MIGCVLQDLLDSGSELRIRSKALNKSLSLAENVICTLTGVQYCRGFVRTTAPINNPFLVIDGQPKGLLLAWHPVKQGFPHSWLRLNIKTTTTGREASLFLDVSPRQFCGDKDASFFLESQSAWSAIPDGSVTPAPAGVGPELVYFIEHSEPVKELSHSFMPTPGIWQAEYSYLVQLSADRPAFFYEALKQLRLSSVVKTSLPPIKDKVNCRCGRAKCVCCRLEWVIVDQSALRGYKAGAPRQHMMMPQDMEAMRISVPPGMMPQAMEGMMRSMSYPGMKPEEVEAMRRSLPPGSAAIILG